MNVTVDRLWNGIWHGLCDQHIPCVSRRDDCASSFRRIDAERLGIAMANTQLSRLDEAIATFEHAVFSPVVPGELVEWSRLALESVEKLQRAVVENAEFNHESIFDTISESDPEMFAHVQKLQAEDQALLQCLQETLKIAKTLQTVATAVDRDEVKAAEFVKGFVKSAESLSVRLKKQEIAIDVWLQESQTRDRGVKD